MALPTNGTAEQIEVRKLDNATLAGLLERYPRGGYQNWTSPAYRAAVLEESVRRLRWADAYEAHK